MIRGIPTIACSRHEAHDAREGAVDVCQRLEAVKQKACRGEHFPTVAIGYLKASHNRIEKDPDPRVQQAIALVFPKFAELQTVRQVHLWIRQERLPLPAVEYGPESRKVVWKLPLYNTLCHILTSPIYAGAYTFDRTESRHQGGP